MTTPKRTIIRIAAIVLVIALVALAMHLMANNLNLPEALRKLHGG